MHIIDLDPKLLADWHGPTSVGIDPKSAALIIVDLQVAFMEVGMPSYGPHALDIVPNVNRLAGAFRNAGAKIIFLRHTIVDEGRYAPPPWRLEDDAIQAAMDNLRPNTAGHALHPSLDMAPNDLVLDKHRYSAFLPTSSSLDIDLRSAGIDTVVITGTMTNVCCESTARDAHMLNYNVVFVADATASLDDAAHNATLDNMARYFAIVKTTDKVLGNLKDQAGNRH